MIAVRLKAVDPAASTALSTLRRTMPGEAPVSLGRYDLWELEMSPGTDTMDRVRSLIASYTDIVNPNKQSWMELGHPDSVPGEDRSQTRVWLVVKDHDDSRSENWSRILRASRFGVRRVQCGVLWRLGYPPGTAREVAEENAMAVALTRSRRVGLLANPVSQEAKLYDEASS